MRKFKAVELKANITVTPVPRVVALCITLLSDLWLGEKVEALRAIAAYFGYRIEKLPA